MGELDGRYLNDHEDQFDGTPLQGANCTPAAGVNGADASTGGRLKMLPGQLRSRVKRWEETNPNTLGWSLPDLALALERTKVAAAEFINRGGQGWQALIDALERNQYVVLQGDSDRFSNNTCSGVFDGDHAVGIHPASRVVGGLRQRWINDGVCKKGRWEYEYILRRYAVKLNPNIQFGHFTHAVPKVAAATPLQALIHAVEFLRAHETGAAARWRRNHPIPKNETTAERMARLRAEVTYLTAARIKRLIPIVRRLRAAHPAAAKKYRAKHPIPATETLSQRAARLTAEIKYLRSV